MVLATFHSAIIILCDILSRAQSTVFILRSIFRAILMFKVENYILLLSFQLVILKLFDRN